MAESLLYSDDYKCKFGPKTYLNSFYQSVAGHEDEEDISYFSLNKYHEFWSNFGSKVKDLTMLEFGGGPCIHTLISACRYAKEIIFAEFTEKNRQEVEAWLGSCSSMHNWSPFFQYIVQTLEGKSESETKQREDFLRGKITQVIPCDIRQNQIIELRDSQRFDVINTSLCLEAVVESEEDYRASIAKLSKLLKPGGHLIMFGVLKQTYYFVGDGKYYTFPLTKDLILQAYKEAKFYDVEFCSSNATGMDRAVSNFSGVFFVHGKLSAPL